MLYWGKKVDTVAFRVCANSAFHFFERNSAPCSKSLTCFPESGCAPINCRSGYEEKPKKDNIIHHTVNVGSIFHGRLGRRRQWAKRASDPFGPVRVARAWPLELLSLHVPDITVDKLTSNITSKTFQAFFICSYWSELRTKISNCLCDIFIFFSKIIRPLAVIITCTMKNEDPSMLVRIRVLHRYNFRTLKILLFTATANES